LQATAKALPGIDSIVLPLPFELKSVNVHILRQEDGYLLIDCGLDTKDSFETLAAGVAALGLEWRDIRRILLTHLHPDHMGLSARLLELTGAELWMHAIEARLLDAIVAAKPRVPWMEAAFQEGGVPEEIQAKIQGHFVRMQRNFHVLSPDVLLQGGEEIPTELGSLRVILTPGHSPGHICLYGGERKVLIAGDQILPSITPNIAWRRDQDALYEYLWSLETLKELDVDHILPSHGWQFSGHREWIEETTAHHHERCELILRFVGERPRTGYELVGLLWGGRLSTPNEQFALVEVLSHLDYLLRRGRVQRADDNGAPRWFV
jgi:glyoxylase-like metal-dependent hydrolase (beta-lactamase superfamily II)